MPRDEPPIDTFFIRTNHILQKLPTLLRWAYFVEYGTYAKKLRVNITHLYFITYDMTIDKPSLLLITDRLILRSPIGSDVLKLKAFDEKNANRLSPWRSTEPGGKLDYLSQVVKSKQEFEDGSALHLLKISY